MCVRGIDWFNSRTDDEIIRVEIDEVTTIQKTVKDCQKSGAPKW
jgi:hypothetical protein